MPRKSPPAQAKKIMAALVRMAPKEHEDMKIGAKKKRKAKKKRAK
jgi:hypothetical protein